MCSTKIVAKMAANTAAGWGLDRMDDFVVPSLMGITGSAEETSTTHARFSALVPSASSSDPV